MNGLDSFLKRLPSHKFYNTHFYKRYLHVLELSWFQKRKDALAYIAKAIEEEIDHEDIHVFYRLWIDLLAETHDRLSLQMLKNHLATMAPQFSNYDQWASLRGLVHFELEELDACAVILRAVGDNTFSPYAMELSQRYQFRFTADTQADLDILKCKAPVTDYCVLQSLAQGMLANGNADELPKLLKKVNENFPHSPIQDHFAFWENFDHNNMKKTIEIGQRLCKRFPENERFRFDLAYVSFCDGKVKEAIRQFESFDMKTRRQDPDTLALLGYAHLIESKDKKNSEDWKKAHHYFTLAKAQADRMGIPSSEIALNLRFMNESKTTSKTRSHYWAIPLTPRRESELMQSEEKDVDFLFHQLRNDIQDNDVICFTSTDHFRVLAFYKVSQAHVWHPYVKNQALLELLHRFPRSVSVSGLQYNDFLEAFQLSDEETQNLLSQVESQGPVRQHILAPAKKQRAVMPLRRIS